MSSCMVCGFPMSPSALNATSAVSKRSKSPSVLAQCVNHSLRSPFLLLPPKACSTTTTDELSPLRRRAFSMNVWGDRSR